MRLYHFPHKYIKSIKYKNQHYPLVHTIYAWLLYNPITMTLFTLSRNTEAEMNIYSDFAGTGGLYIFCQSTSCSSV